MKQIVQSLKDGQIEIVQCPVPQVKRGHLLIRSEVSLISAGTERMLLEFGRANLLQKAKQQPERVREVLEKVRADGLISTLDAVSSKLNQSIPLGYCNSGTVVEVGAGVTDIEVGDRVVSNGHHAEIVCVPQNLCAKIPDDVDSPAASFTVVSAIGLQGIRLAAPTLGESFAVVGLGLIGLLTVQLLKAQGCRVLGIDPDERRLELARGFGAETVSLSAGEDPVARALAFTRGRGADGVILTAATKSHEPVRQAAQMCRKRGRLVLVGVVGLNLSRNDFYEKELSFQVSCSYGPGRYDPSFEQQGVDYPIGFVRWTEQRNFEAVLDMLQEGRLEVESLTSHTFPLSQAGRAYELISAGTPSLGVLLKYSSSAEDQRFQTVRISDAPRNAAASTLKKDSGIAVIGAGNYASRVLIPAFVRAKAPLRVIVSQGGLSAVQVAKKFRIAEASSQSADDALKRPDVQTAIVATRHDSHAEIVSAALSLRKNVYVEKPLAISHAGLDQIEQARNACDHPPIIMVGFNRRFAPLTRQMTSLLAPLSGPMIMVMTVNAGALPDDHWNHKHDVGGGRVVGEACHFIDLLRHLAGNRIVSLQASMIGRTDTHVRRDDKVTMTLGFEDGSLGTVHYLANGHRSLPKERLEVFCEGRVLQLDNFRSLRGFGWKRMRRVRHWRQDKGHQQAVEGFLGAVAGRHPSPIPFDELMEVSRVALDVLPAAESGTMIRYERGPGDFLKQPRLARSA